MWHGRPTKRSRHWLISWWTTSRASSPVGLQIWSTAPIDSGPLRARLPLPGQRHARDWSVPSPFPRLLHYGENGVAPLRRSPVPDQVVLEGRTARQLRVRTHKATGPRPEGLSRPRWHKPGVVEEPGDAAGTRHTWVVFRRADASRRPDSRYAAGHGAGAWRRARGCGAREVSNLVARRAYPATAFDRSRRRSIVSRHLFNESPQDTQARVGTKAPLQLHTR